MGTMTAAEKAADEKKWADFNFQQGINKKPDTAPANNNNSSNNNNNNNNNNNSSPAPAQRKSGDMTGLSPNDPLTKDKYWAELNFNKGNDPNYVPPPDTYVKPGTSVSAPVSAPVTAPAAPAINYIKTTFAINLAGGINIPAGSTVATDASGNIDLTKAYTLPTGEARNGLPNTAPISPVAPVAAPVPAAIATPVATPPVDAAPVVVPAPAPNIPEALRGQVGNTGEGPGRDTITPVSAPIVEDTPVAAPFVREPGAGQFQKLPVVEPDPVVSIPTPVVEPDQPTIPDALRNQVGDTGQGAGRDTITPPVDAPVVSTPFGEIGVDISPADGVTIPVGSVVALDPNGDVDLSVPYILPSGEIQPALPNAGTIPAADAGVSVITALPEYGGGDPVVVVTPPSTPDDLGLGNQIGGGGNGVGIGVPAVIADPPTNPVVITDPPTNPVVIADPPTDSTVTTPPSTPDDLGLGNQIGGGGNGVGIGVPAVIADPPTNPVVITAPPASGGTTAPPSGGIPDPPATLPPNHTGMFGGSVWRNGVLANQKETDWYITHKNFDGYDAYQRAHPDPVVVTPPVTTPPAVPMRGDRPATAGEIAWNTEFGNYNGYDNWFVAGSNPLHRGSFNSTGAPPVAGTPGTTPVGPIAPGTGDPNFSATPAAIQALANLITATQAAAVAAATAYGYMVKPIYDATGNITGWDPVLDPTTGQRIPTLGAGTSAAQKALYEAQAAKEVSGAVYDYARATGKVKDPQTGQWVSTPEALLSATQQNLNNAQARRYDDQTKMEQQNYLSQALADPNRFVEAFGLAQLQGTRAGGTGGQPGGLWGYAQNYQAGVPSGQAAGAQAAAVGAQAAATNVPGALASGTNNAVNTQSAGNSGQSGQAQGALPAGTAQTTTDLVNLAQNTQLPISGNLNAAMSGQYVPTIGNATGSQGTVTNLADVSTASGNFAKINPVVFRNLDTATQGQYGSLAQSIQGINATDLKKMINAQLPGSSGGVPSAFRL